MCIYGPSCERNIKKRVIQSCNCMSVSCGPQLLKLHTRILNLDYRILSYLFPGKGNVTSFASTQETQQNTTEI